MAETPSRVDPLIVVVHEFDTGKLEPGLVNKTWQSIWGEWGKRVGHEFKMPEVEINKFDLEQQRARYGRIPLLIPDEVMTPEGLLLLSKLKPSGIMLSDEQILKIENDSDKGGLVYVDLEPRTHLGLDGDEFVSQLAANESGQRLATFFVASHFRKLGLGRHMNDDLTYSRIPGSTFSDGRSLTSSFNPDGSMLVIPGIDLGITLPHLGWRTEVRGS